ncbi:MAG: hypothetical protein JWO48_289 [Bryobacterales bacterium]|nr:hypothetical protein [Bryobacterales bacterium]
MRAADNQALFAFREPKRHRAAYLLAVLILALGVTAKAASTLYAATNLGPYKSTDGGATWKQIIVTATDPLLQGAPGLRALVVDPYRCVRRSYCSAGCGALHRDIVCRRPDAQPMDRPCGIARPTGPPAPQEGFHRLLSETTPSHRLWATAPSATQARRIEHTTGGPADQIKTGTFYFARKRNFLLCLGRAQARMSIRP